MPSYIINFITRVIVYTDEPCDLTDIDEVQEILVEKAQSMIDKNDNAKTYGSYSEYIERDYKIQCYQCWSEDNCQCHIGE